MSSTRHPLGRARTWAVSTLLAASVGTAAVGYHLADVATQTVAASSTTSSVTSTSNSSSSTGTSSSSSFGSTSSPGSSSGSAQAATTGS